LLTKANQKTPPNYNNSWGIAKEIKFFRTDTVKNVIVLYFLIILGVSRKKTEKNKTSNVPINKKV